MEQDMVAVPLSHTLGKEGGLGLLPEEKNHRKSNSKSAVVFGIIIYCVSSYSKIPLSCLSD